MIFQYYTKYTYDDVRFTATNNVAGFKYLFHITFNLLSNDVCWWMELTELSWNKYSLKRKEKNKSREEIFYQMKVFFC